MALEGTLRDFSFADILQLISLQRKTGVLTLKNEDNVVTISFLDGRIVGANSLNQHTEDRLGLILLKQGTITEAQLEAALRRQEETLQRLGRILIDARLVAGERVREALEQQILQIVYRIFRWADGEYHFSQETDIDYDKDLLVPMVADSIIMEGARMTDEWPFVDQRIPDRNAIFIKTNPARKVEVAEASDDDLDDLGFSFTDTPEEEPAAPETKDERLTRDQVAVYRLVNGRDSVAEIILESPIIEFDTCKAMADLVDRGFIRPARPEEVAHTLYREQEKPPGPVRAGLSAVPWLAIPFLVLLGFSLTVMGHNPLNPDVGVRKAIWDSYVLEAASWLRMERLLEAGETAYYFTGLYPDSADVLKDEAWVNQKLLEDPWHRRYTLGFNTAESKLRASSIESTVNGRDSFSQSLLLLSRSLAWEGQVNDAGNGDGPGVVLID
jgi:hypothetical protein